MIGIDMMNKRIESHVAGIKDATNRSRNVFLFLNLTTLVIVIAMFNETYTWQRHMNVSDRPYKSYFKTVGLDSTDCSFQELRKHYADMYFDRQFFNIPLLGIKCTESDLTVFAPIALLIFTTWFFFSLRRENHIVKAIWMDFVKIKAKITTAADINTAGEKAGNEDEWKLLLHSLYSGCIQGFVLSTPTNKDYNNKNNQDKPNKIARPIMNMLYWSPVIVLAYILFNDVLEYVLHDFLQPHGKEIMIMDLFMSILGVLITYQINVNRKINNNTREMLLSMARETSDTIYEL